MNIKIKKQDKSQIIIECSVPSEQFSKFINSALKNLAENMEIKGFRKGKVPIDMASKLVKESDILQYGAELCINEIYPKIIKDYAIEPIENPEISIKSAQKETGLEWEAKLSILPEIKLADYKNLSKTIKTKSVIVDEKEVNKSIQQLLKSRAIYQEKNTPVIKGDLITATIEVRYNNEIIPASNMKNHSFVLGEGKFMPGFEDNIIGMQKGEQKEFSLIAPNDYYKKELTGKKLDFLVKITDTKEIILPELNNDFVKSISSFNSLEELKQSIAEGIRQEKEEKEKERVKTELIEKISEKSFTEIPDILITMEFEKMMAELKESLEKMGLNLKLYLEMIKKAENELKEELRKQAQKRIKIALTLREIAIKENIEVTEKEIEEEINKELRNFKTISDAKKEIDLEELKNYTKNVLKNKKVFELLQSYNN